ncbi:MAG: hypothetical protein WEB04_02195 [Dehalococcoidia bacterium]
MKGIKRLGLGVAVAAALLAVAGFVVSAVFASSGSISISDGSAEPGGSGTVELSANVDGEGLGAWTVDITYDPAVVTVDSCDAEEGLCNPDFTATSVRFVGADPNGLDGDTLLGTITFDCADAEDTTDLTMALDVFVDAEPGVLAPIEPATINNGSFACEVEPTAGPADTATPTLPAGGISNTGTGIGSDGSGMSWVIVALIGAGLFAVTSVTALRVSTRRS